MREGSDGAVSLALPSSDRLGRSHQLLTERDEGYAKEGLFARRHSCSPGRLCPIADFVSVRRLVEARCSRLQIRSRSRAWSSSAAAGGGDVEGFHPGALFNGEGESLTGTLREPEGVCLQAVRLCYSGKWQVASGKWQRLSLVYISKRMPELNVFQEEDA